MPKKAKLPKKSYRVWNVFLLKADYQDEKKYLVAKKGASPLDRYVVKLAAAKEAILFTRQATESEPSWVKQFKGLTDKPILVRAKTAAALLVVTTSKRVYALTFGYGRSLLASDAWEQEFGLKVVLNTIGEEGIKQIQLSAFDALLQSKQAQSVRNARIDEFGLDVEQDIIRSLTGVPSDASLGRSIGGRDSARLSTEVPFENLPGLLDRLLADSGRNDYLKTFSWIGRLKEIRDKTLKAELDALLVEKMSNTDVERMWLASPTYQDWEAGRSFQIPGIAEPQDDLRLLEILEEWDMEDPIEEITIEDLKARKIVVINDNDDELDKYSFYRAIYCEVEHGGGTYLLNNASWYLVQSDYLKEVDDAIAKIPQTLITLPDYSDQSEEDYIKRLCALDKDYCLMDQKFIQLKARGFTKVEFCDVATLDKKLVHIKRYSGSSTLSHLFAQGIVPAELYLNVPEFREKVNAKLAASHRLKDPHQPIKAAEYEIVYAIVSKSSKADIKLPFFSKVMLRNASTALSNMNYKVSLCKIANKYVAPKVAAGAQKMGKAK